MDILTNIRGLTYALPDLYSQISSQGWEIKHVKYDKSQDRIVATATNPHGEEMSNWGDSDTRAVSNLLMNIVARNGMRMGKVSRWTHTFTDQLSAIAEAYSKAALYEPKAAIAFMELARDSEHRAKSLQEHLEITVVNNPEPYTDPQKMFDDIRQRRKLEVSRAGLDHPIWSANQVVAYRIVHDVLGHAASGGGFDWEGENRAFAAHAAILPVEAQKALFTESIASAAYATYFRSYGPLKVALFDEFLDPVQKAENPHGGYRGVHPSQSHPPVEEPAVKPILGHLAADARIGPKMAQGAPGALTDPNEGWQSGVAPLPVNARLDYGDPLEAKEGMDNAALIDTEWAYLNKEDPVQVATMKQAVTNAFRVVLLSPQKDLRWNAVHYQDISNVPGDEDRPSEYWKTLENARQTWNVERYGEEARYQHMPWYKEWKMLEQLTWQRNPHRPWSEVQEETLNRIVQWRTQEEERILADYADLPEEDQPDGYKIELEANKAVQARLDKYLKPSLADMDEHTAAAVTMPREGDQPMFDIAPTQKEEIPDMAKYGAFMGSHLVAISQISRHVDEILKAALFDVHEKDGSGHHFRATVLALNITGVGPKVCSFAWLLLQPTTSQLGTIDTHMIAVLGYKEKDMTPRDYFKMERQLQAGRDASGYGDVPLGAFQWMMWDHKRTGPGSHQDHSAMKVLNPSPHSLVDWKSKTQGMSGTGWSAPAWWQATEPARDAVGEDFDNNVSPGVPPNQIPYNQGMPIDLYPKTARSAMTPWFTHPQTGERVQGTPGQTIMQHMRQVGLTLPQAWGIDEAGKA